jgi:hypothetical protein
MGDQGRLDRLAGSPANTRLPHAAALQKLPLDGDEVFGNDTFIGRERRQRVHETAMKGLEGAGIFADDRIASGEDFGEAREVEPLGVWQTDLLRHRLLPSIHPKCPMFSRFVRLHYPSKSRQSLLYLETCGASTSRYCGAWKVFSGEDA